MAVNRKPLSQLLSEVQMGEDITNRAASGQGFDPRGGWGVAAAQIATAGIGAWAKNRAQKEIAEREVASQEQFGSFLSQKGYTPESVAAITSSTDATGRQSIIQEFIKKDLKGSEPLTGIAKLGADYKAGLIDAPTYKAAVRKETSFAPDSSSTGGATGAIIANLRAENPNLSYAQALSQAQGLARQGLGFNASGNVAPISGLTQSKSDIAAAEVAGKARGETTAGLASQQAKLPELEATVKELKDLSKIATFTKAGQLRDVALREANLPMSKGGLARAEYISKVDNQVLPLLRDTFGAAFTQKEGDTLRATLGDPNKSPSEKDAILNSFIKQKRATVESMKREVKGSTNQPAARVRRFNPQTGGFE